MVSDVVIGGAILVKKKKNRKKISTIFDKCSANIFHGKVDKTFFKVPLA